MNQQQISLLPEAELEFRYGQRVLDPRDGLSLFGPFDTDLPSHPKSIVYGVIGPDDCLDAVKGWSRKLIQPVLTDPEAHDVRNWPHFPGFEAAFSCQWPSTPAWFHRLDRGKVMNAVKIKNAHRRTATLVDMYLAGIDTAESKRDEKFHVLLCVVPDLLWKNCRPLSHVQDGTGVELNRREIAERASGPDMFNSYDPDEYRRSVDFRRQLKARAMRHGIPIQIIKESTLNLEPTEDLGLRKESPRSSVAWFLTTALYYKAGGKPWRLCSARPGVCYVGLAFRRAGEAFRTRSRTACCAAQMFLDTGDGIVFKGEFGPWYSPDDEECHLSGTAAESLLRGVLETYQELDGRPLTEVFIHSQSEILAEEFAGYSRACPTGVNVFGVRVRRDDPGLKLFRQADLPVQRGTLLTLSDKTCFLWSAGFKLRLETYDGFSVPIPLRIDVQHGNADIRQVAADILGLTKLNYNTCRLGAVEPVTVGYSNRVGEILVTNPTVQGCRPQFKFYI